MKKRIRKVLGGLIILAVISAPINAEASEKKEDALQVQVCEEVRSESESEALKEIYKNLFPNQYHYIDEYERNGVSDLDINDIDIIFNETKSYNGIDYTLVVYNNGQIFTNIAETIQTNDAFAARKNDTSSRTKSFRVGDIGHYTTFVVTYIVDIYGYDYIDSYTTGSTDFYLYPQCKRYKKYEDNSGNAYIAYNNVSMNYDGSGVLYDLGVAVGNNGAQGYASVAKGWDMFLTCFLNAFILSD